MLWAKCGKDPPDGELNANHCSDVASQGPMAPQGENLQVR